MDTKSFADLWARRRRRSEATSAAAFWDRRAPSFNAHMREKKARERHRRRMQTIFDRTGLKPDASVLDIGCGSGAHALALAPLVRHVEAFDISPAMIALAQENARLEGCENVNFRVLDWAHADCQALGWNRAFDLVMAIRTPALDDADALAKMLAASRHACCIITHVYMQHSVREALKKHIARDTQRARTENSFYCAFNLLYLMGYYPEVSYVDRSWETACPLEEAELLHMHYFEKQYSLTAAQKEAMQASLKAMSRNGKVQEKVRAKLALLTWCVEEKKSPAQE